MPFTIELHSDGYLPGRNQTTVRMYVHGDDDEFAAISAIYSGAAWILINGHFLQDIRLDERLGVYNGEVWWLATVTYGVNQTTAAVGGPVDSDKAVLRCSTRGGVQHITHSRETVGSYAAAGSTAPDFKQSIGVNENGIAGVDIIIPAFTWSLTKRVPATDVDEAYVLFLESATGCVNVSEYKGRPAGSVRFEGADLETVGSEVQLVFSFRSERNVEDQTIGDITGIDKEGFDYLWVRFEERTDEESNTLVKVPAAVYVERVAPRIDLNLLGA